MRGIEGQTPLLSDAVDLTQGFWSKDIGQALIDYGDPCIYRLRLSNFRFPSTNPWMIPKLKIYPAMAQV